MGVLHMLAPAPFGGLESVVAALAAGCSARRREVHVCGILGDMQPMPPLLESLSEAGVDVRALRPGRRSYLRERRAVRDVVAELRPIVLHTHGYRADVIGGWATRGGNDPAVSTVHGFTGGDWKNRVYERVQRRALRGFDAVVAVSHPLADELRSTGVPPGRLHTILNAWDSNRPILPASEARDALGAPSDRFHVGWVGRLSDEKDPRAFVEALALLRSESWKATLVGDGPLLDVLRERVAAVGAGGSPSPGGSPRQEGCSRASTCSY